ncbi:MAG: acetyl-CoA carboxylase carboxyltransferase subunit alpha [Lentisphaerae bacterium RIFOXYB12_FULL_65_16]|nr:MAG: acetyl-CoA carboxylase carboxyltransferase subunit alpha [Lentisphaerae bacterium RIFOXYA12_64_32]OGV90481.1 MAG: acetyl-CoA carboxylase carboxyltransferase subunit alpha [Lentisphaerae bacterium RIFOXYB12_FULL_65_16]
MTAYMDFERPIRELEKKAAELRELSARHDADSADGVRLLEARIAEAKRQIFAGLTAWQRVQMARHPLRPFPEDYLQRMCVDFLELHGDRRFADDPAVIGGFAKLGGCPVMVIGTRKGRDLLQSQKVNFGMVHPDGFRKALRLMQMADKAQVPIVSLIDTPGAYPDVGAEARHMGEAIAENLREMFQLRVPVVVVVVGEGGGAGALGLGVGNRLLILENAYLSVVLPEVGAAALWGDEAAAAEAAETMKLTSAELHRLGLVDEVVPEPLGGAHTDYDKASELLGEVLCRHLDELRRMTPEERVSQRYAKFRAMGVVQGSA